MKNTISKILNIFILKKGEEITLKKVRATKWQLWLILALTFIAFLDGLYLSVNKIYSSSVTCVLFKGCDAVQNSIYSSFLGIPLPFIGAIGFLLILLLLIRYIETKNKLIWNFIFYATILGSILALYLIILQGFILKSWCIYCLITDTIAIINFILVLLVNKNKELL